VKARRTRWVFFYCADYGFVDVERLLRGEARAVSLRQLYAIAVLAGREVAITEADLELVLALSSAEWSEVEASARLRELARDGLVLLDDPDPELTRLRELDERVGATEWNAYAALYHGLTRRRGVDIRAAANEDAEAETLVAEGVERFVAQHGPPPPHFHSVRALDRRELPLVERRGGLYDALVARETTRVFEPGPVAEEELAVLLYYAFGCQGTLVAHPEVVALRRTSPSGGGLHPVEVYPLLIDVEGLEPGLYHYGLERHELELLERVDQAEAADLAVAFTCGQTYFGGAGALFLLTARFYRSFWKYRNQERAYAVLLMDAAHLSEAFYLVCAELGLGAFVTAALNNGEIDDRLGLDGFTEGALVACGCGRRSERASQLHPEFVPFRPRR
jgi:putative peptide maturation dehydrogenase